MAKIPIEGREVLLSQFGSLIFSAPVESGRIAECDGYFIPGSFYMDVWVEGLIDDTVGRIHFKANDGHIEVSELTFRSRPIWFEVHDHTLNDLPLNDLAFAAWVKLTEGQERHAPPKAPTMSRKGAHMKQVLEILREIELIDVAVAYCHEPSKGTQLAMDQMGYKSRSTASLKVKQAREKGLIPPHGSKPEKYEKALVELKRKRESLETEN